MNNLLSPAQLPLRDITLPTSVSWWPLAPGWWIVSGLIAILIISAAVWHRRRRRHRASALYQSGLELARLKQACRANPNDQQLLCALSALIRRVAISVYPRVDTASLSGEKWLLFLDQIMPNQPFSTGPGQVLASGPYQTNSRFDAPALLALTEAWLIRAGEANRA